MISIKQLYRNGLGDSGNHRGKCKESGGVSTTGPWVTSHPQASVSLSGNQASWSQCGFNAVKYRTCCAQNRAGHTVGAQYMGVDFVGTELPGWLWTILANPSRTKCLSYKCYLYIYVYIKIYIFIHKGLGKTSSRRLWVPVGSSVK